jgi:hypothetical protein
LLIKKTTINNMEGPIKNEENFEERVEIAGRKIVGKIC